MVKSEITTDIRISLVLNAELFQLIRLIPYGLNILSDSDKGCIGLLFMIHRQISDFLECFSSNRLYSAGAIVRMVCEELFYFNFSSYTDNDTVCKERFKRYYLSYYQSELDNLDVLLYNKYAEPSSSYDCIYLTPKGVRHINKCRKKYADSFEVLLQSYKNLDNPCNRKAAKFIAKYINYDKAIVGRKFVRQPIDSLSWFEETGDCHVGKWDPKHHQYGHAVMARMVHNYLGHRMHQLYKTLYTPACSLVHSNSYEDIVKMAGRCSLSIGGGYMPLNWIVIITNELHYLICRLLNMYYSLYMLLQLHEFYDMLIDVVKRNDLVSSYLIPRETVLLERIVNFQCRHKLECDILLNKVDYSFIPFTSVRLNKH